MSTLNAAAKGYVLRAQVCASALLAMRATHVSMPRVPTSARGMESVYQLPNGRNETLTTTTISGTPILLWHVFVIQDSLELIVH